jgi:lactoylglutathione lyase
LLALDSVRTFLPTQTAERQRGVCVGETPRGDLNREIEVGPGQFAFVLPRDSTHMSLLHASLCVEDEEATLEFYRDVLGYEQKWSFTDDDGLRNFYLDHPDDEDDEPDLQVKVVGEPVDPAGIDHVAIEVADVDALVSEVPDERVLKAPFDMEGYDLRVAHVADPDGYRVELIQFLDE